MKKPLIQTCVARLILPGLFLAGCVGTHIDQTHDDLREALIDRDARRARARREAASDSTDKRTDDLPKISGPLSLADAMILAMDNNRILRIAHLTRGEAEGRLIEAVAQALPGLTADASAHTRLQDGTQSDIQSLDVELTQPLWRSGAVAAGLRYAQLNAARTDLTIRQHVQDTVHTVASTFMDVLLREHLVAVYDEAAASAERLLETTRSRRRQGTVSDYDVLRADVEVARAHASRIQARNTLQSSRVALFQHLGVSQDSAVTLDGRLAYSAEAFDPGMLETLAAVERPDIARALAALRMAEEEINVVKSDYGPKADLFASGTYSNIRDETWEDDWIAGARLSLMLFDGFERRGRLITARSRRDQAAETLRETEERAHVERVNALLQLRYADELYQSQKKNIDLAREALRMIEAGARQGRNTQVEVLDAQAALTEAMGAYYNAVHGHCLARLGVRRAAGTLRPDETVTEIVAPDESAPRESAPPPLPTPTPGDLP